MSLFIAQHFDADDEVYRVAGLYEREQDAWARVEELGAGIVQCVNINEPIRFTFEQPGESAKEGQP